MNKKGRLLTVAQFAEEKGISRCTVHKWLKQGRLIDVTRHACGPYLIPESNLSIEKMTVGRHKLAKTPTTNLIEAREKYDAISEFGYERKIPFSYDELLELFETDKTYLQIAKMSGVSRQRIEQVYKMYFSPFMSSGRNRRKKLFKERWRESSTAYIEKVTKLSLLKQIAEEKGFKVTPIQAEHRPSQCYNDRLLINDKLCRVYLSQVSSEMGPRNYRRYHRVNMAKSVIEKVEFVIVLTGDMSRRIFIFPSRLIRSQFSEEESYKTFYIPSEKLPPYNNQLPNIDWWHWEDAWSQLE